MNDIYLIRHTTPAVGKGICYGQTDLDVTADFLAETEAIRPFLPAAIQLVYSSPLRRCAMLAQSLFPTHELALRADLMEVHCGQWEMRAWDELPPAEIDPWMADFVNVRIPGGESYIDLQTRVMRCWEEIGERAAGPVAVVAHGGVIRSILATLTGVPLLDSFKAFSLYYGCVVRVTAGGYEVLYNKAPETKEQHKPSSFYK